VYRAQLAETLGIGVQSTFKRTVAVKTLKGKPLLLPYTCTVCLNLQCNIGFFDQNEINKIMEEGVKMKQFDHPNVMGLIGVCIDAGPAPYIVMPYMVNGSLLSYLRKERPNLLLNETADGDSVSFGSKYFYMLLFKTSCIYISVLLSTIQIPWH